MARVDKVRRTYRRSLGSQNRFFWMFGLNRRLDRRWEKETDLPNDGSVPNSWHLRDMETELSSNENHSRILLGMLIPITVIASSPPTERMLSNLRAPGTTLIADRATARLAGTERAMAEGRLIASKPDVYYLTPGCPCCAVRQDLVDSVVRATRHAAPPKRLLVVVDPVADDLLVVITTILSSTEITRRCSLDSVLVHVDAVELATRLTTGAEPLDDRLTTALAVADRIVVDGCTHVTPAIGQRIRTELRSRSGFAQLVDCDNRMIGGGVRLHAWHGAPEVHPIEPARTDQPSTIVLRVDQPLDSEAIEEWIDMLLARYAIRLLRIQGALSVLGHRERTCCHGVRSFATSYSEQEHLTRSSTESVLAICGVGLDAAELASSFRATVAL